MNHPLILARLGAFGDFHQTLNNWASVVPLDVDETRAALSPSLGTNLTMAFGAPYQSERIPP